MPLLDAALPVFREAGDFRCVTRTLLELAAHAAPGRAVDLLVQALPTSAIASGTSLPALVLAELVTAAAAAGELVLAARALGVLEAFGEPGPAGTVDPALAATLAGAPLSTFSGEGRAGGIDLLTTLYPR